jgi:hypothetical protein
MTFTAAAPVAGASIPTLSQWGLLLLSGLLALGAFFSRGRQAGRHGYR